MLNNSVETSINKPFISKIIQIYLSVTKVLEKIALPVLVLFMRLWMAKIFWYSGMTKISNWQSTVFLFREEYKVPFVPPEITACLATSFELACPVLLIFGFATRLATLPLLAMTAVIQFTYLDLIDHRYWAMLLALILFYGPGSLSLDHLIFKKFGLLASSRGDVA
ncbi:TPA: DoxX family protein [Legionella pneumophila]|nr:DoxX family protein [Legionella pneumophila]HAT8189311.1 DoxX family membrane protein [Legionella pneumophila]